LDFLPKVIAKPRPDDGLGKGMELALTLALFVGLGLLLDRWLGTAPWFAIGLSVFGVAGQTARMWYGYEARMRALEAERAARRSGPAEHQITDPTSSTNGAGA
jgi:hypothetical protein